MPYAITGPDRMQYHWLIADGPLDALHRLHAEALMHPRAVQPIGGRLLFADPAEQEPCTALWQVTALGAGVRDTEPILSATPARSTATRSKLAGERPEMPPRLM